MAKAGNEHRRKRHPLKWFGGKYWLSKVIDAYTPPHDTYVEPFAGGAHVFFEKEQSDLEVLNDRDSHLINFFQVLQDKKLFEEFSRMVQVTPYSSELFYGCRAKYPDYKDKVRRAWAWYVAHRQARNGMSECNWSHYKGKRGKPGSASVRSWRSAVEGLTEVSERLLDAQLEKEDFITIFEKHDSETTWFYADPPYVPDTRVSGRYACEMSFEDHMALVDVLLDLKGMCMLSGYDSDMYAPLESSGWRRKVIPVKSPMAKYGYREECLWLSPNLLKALWKVGKCLDLKDDLDIAC